MTIDQAIEVLTEETETGFQGHPYTLREAIQLGIEALKRVKRYKRLWLSWKLELLPGETKD